MEFIYQEHINDTFRLQNALDTFETAPPLNYNCTSANEASMFFQIYAYYYERKYHDNENWIKRVNNATLFFHQSYKIYEPVRKMIEKTVFVHSSFSLAQLLGRELLDDLQEYPLLKNENFDKFKLDSGFQIFAPLFLKNNQIWNMSEIKNHHMDIIQAINFNPGVLLLIENKKFSYIKDFFPQFKELLDTAYNLFPDDTLERYENMGLHFCNPINRNIIENVEFN